MGNNKINDKKSARIRKVTKGLRSSASKKRADNTMVERGALVYEAVEKNKQKNVLGLIVGLIVVLMASILFMGAVSGWFNDGKVMLDREYVCDGECEMMEMTADLYEELIKKKGSFVVFVDQSGCTTADKLRGFVQNWADENKVKIYKMMFSDARDTSLHNSVKYYPSVAVISNGVPVAWLRADENEDSDAYNDEGAFTEWINRFF